MLTTQGQSLLDDLLSELTEKTEDQKQQIILEQGGSILRSLFSALGMFFHVLFTVSLTVFIITLLGATEETVNLFQTATPQELLHSRDVFIQIIIFMSIIITVIWLIFKRNRPFINIQREVEKNNEQQVKDSQNTIELIEEVLHRHQLINKVK